MSSKPPTPQVADAEPLRQLGPARREAAVLLGHPEGLDEGEVLDGGQGFLDAPGHGHRQVDGGVLAGRHEHHGPGSLKQCRHGALVEDLDDPGHEGRIDAVAEQLFFLHLAQGARQGHVAGEGDTLHQEGQARGRPARAEEGKVACVHKLLYGLAHGRGGKKNALLLLNGGPGRLRLGVGLGVRVDEGAVDVKEGDERGVKVGHGILSCSVQPPHFSERGCDGDRWP